MIDSELIKSIKSLHPSIEFEEDSQCFLLGELENWMNIAKELKEKQDL